MNKNFKAFVFGAALVAGGLFAAAVGSLTTFAPGTPIKSSEVNGNFAALKTAVEALEAPIGLSRLEVGGSPVDGKVLKLEGGGLNWADDLMGAGGVAAYSAGTGLALSGTTFSIANGGVGTAQLGNAAVALPKLDIAGSAGSGKVLGYNGSKLEWQTLAPSASSVQTDNTLKGNGTSGNPLGIRLPLNLDGTSSAGALLSVVSRGTANAVFGQSLGNSAGVSGFSSNSVGVVGESSSSTLNTPGVKGINLNSSGQVVGVVGEALYSPIGTGVGGFGSVTGGYFQAQGGASGGFNPTGVMGVANNTAGRGVVGTSTGGIGGYFETNNGGGSTPALALRQRGSGYLITGWAGNSTDVNDSIFRVDANGNMYIKTAYLTSDRNRKTNFRNVNALDILEKIKRLPISRWNYKDDSASVQHIGPMAQDFHAAFGLSGSDDKHISAVDAQGVALAAIQGLNQKLEAREARIAQLEATLVRLEERLSRLERR